MKIAFTNLGAEQRGVRDRKVTLWGRPPACQLRCLWLRRELETTCAGRLDISSK